MARISFNSVFRQSPDGSLEPTQRIRVGGVEFGPGVRFNRGVSFGGVDFTLFVGRDFEVETDVNGVLVLQAIY